MPASYKPHPHEHILFLILRRMRAPLIVMISITAISVLGMVLIPGVDEHGRPYHMGFFEAFYFVSFMTTTIGFGEIPHTFTAAQRFWVTLCIYPTVIGWLYAFGTILTLMQDAAFKRTVFHAAFARHIRNLREPFYLICGYGATGHMLVGKLTDEYRQCVVIDIDQQIISELTVEDLHLYVPGLDADASESEHLVKAGLRHPMCRAVAAVTNDDRVNLKIAMTTRLLHPQIPVVARAERSETASNMQAFGVHHVINHFATFAKDLAEAMKYPTHFRFRSLLMEGQDPKALAERISASAKRPWLLCGFGSLGQVLYQRLTAEGINLEVIGTGDEGDTLPKHAITGRAFEEEILLQAGVGKAGGIIAASDDDMDNLSIVAAAKRLNPDIFCVARQVVHTNDALFETVNVDLRMQGNELVARKAHVWLAVPLLHDFSEKIAQISEKHMQRLMQRITAKVGAETFETWQVRLDDFEAPGMVNLLRQGSKLCLGHLLRDPWHPEKKLPQIALLVEQQGREWILPGPSLPIAEGMNILFCGRRTTAWRSVLLQREALAHELHCECEVKAEAA